MSKYQKYSDEFKKEIQVPQVLKQAVIRTGTLQDFDVDMWLIDKAY